MKKRLQEVGILFEMTPMEIGFLIIFFVFIVLGLERLASTGSLYAKKTLIFLTIGMIILLLAFLIGYQIKRMLRY